MKKPPFSRHLLLLLTAALLIYSTSFGQIAGSSGSLSLSPSAATIVDPAITVGGSTDLTDATVQIAANFYTGDVLSFDNNVASSFGISGNYSTTDVSGILRFSGTTSPANWQTLFRTVTYQNSDAACGPSSRTIIFMQGDVLYNPFNNHYYEFVGDYVNWKDAKAGAASRSFSGMQGYLATSTSVAENNFIWKLMAADAWVGASYDYEEINAATGTNTFNDQNAAIGHVYWVTGPEKGTYISSDLFSPVAQNGEYINWAGGEPNDAGDEFYVELYSGNEGMWNDLPNGASLPYVVEYGGLPNDVPVNTTFSRSLTLTSTVGGDINGGNVSVCAGSNSTSLTTTAQVSGVTILRWESSLDNFLTPGTLINNTTSTLTVTNLTQTTYFRSVASGHSCSEAPSSSAKITVGATVAGNLAALHTSICNGSAAHLTLSGYNGDILKWQTSTDNSSWNDIANTNPLYITGPLTPGIYYYRTEVQNAACSGSIFATPVAITVTTASQSVGGTLSGAANACGPDNTGTITLGGYTGSVLKWQSSVNNGNSWSDISNTNDSYTFNNINATTQYRAVIQNGACDAVNSSSFTVTYSSVSNTWTGTTNTDFGTGSNWSCSVPGPGTNIIISGTAPNMPVLDQDRSLHNISFESNTNIDLNGHVFTVSGALSGTNTGTFTGSGSSSIVLANGGDAGTIYFDQSVPGTSNLLNGLTINRDSLIVPTPPSSPVCTPYLSAYGATTGIGITNVTLGSINNTTSTDINGGYSNYYDTQSTLIDPSGNYDISVTIGNGDYQGIRIWIDWNNNGVFGDNANEIITDYTGGNPGTYTINFTAPEIGGDITGGAKTMRVQADIYWDMDLLDQCNGEVGELEDYKINLTPLTVSKGQVTLGNDLLVGGSVTFNKGIINTGSSTLIIAAGATVSGTSNNSYTNGNVRKVGNTAFTFPVGNQGFYAPISISAPSGISDHFTASYSKVNPITVYNNTTYGSGLTGISSNEYWILNRTNGNSNVAVTLSWDAARSTAVANLLQQNVAHWNGSAWTNAGHAGTTGTVTAGTVTSNTQSSFSPFTLGTGSVLLPVTLVNFTAVKINQKASLNWQTASETNNSRFEIERSTNGTTWIKIGEMAGKGNSNTLVDYNFMDEKPVTGNNYYRLKQVDIDGKFVYSPLRLLNFSTIQNIMLYPNPFSGSITIDNGNKIIGDLTIIDMTGKIVYHSTIQKSKETINLGHLAPGQYSVLQNGNYYKVMKAE